MRYAYAVILLCAAPALGAGPAHFYLPAEVLQPTDSPCTRMAPSSSGGQKTTWACSPGQSVWTTIAFPDAALITGVCAGGSNDGTTCVDNSACTGGGHCASFFTVDLSVRVNSNDTSKRICFESSIETTIQGGSWPANDGLDAVPVRSSTPVTASFNTTIVTHVTLVEAWDSVNGLDCQRSVCENMHSYLLLRRADTVNCANDIDTLDVEIEMGDVSWSVP